MKIWKIKREFMRLREQLIGAVALLWEPWVQRKYERERSLVVQRWAGLIELDNCIPRVAVFLVFQPTGLAESTFEACEYLKRKGFSTLVVSNAQLESVDLDRLRKICWQVVQRPNYGYDFGGYREGILQLKELACQPHELLLVNDSIWFPFPLLADPIDQVRKDPASIVGILNSEDKRSRIGSHVARPSFICSFFIHFKKTAIDHPAFRDFWIHYRYSNSKHKTIRRGERGISCAMRTAGLQLNSLVNRDKFDQWIKSLNASEAEHALRLLVTHEDHTRGRVEGLMMQSIKNHNWLVSAKEVLIDATNGQNYPSLMPYLFFSNNQPGYFKKALDPINAEAMRKVLASDLVRDRIFRDEMSSRIYY